MSRGELAQRAAIFLRKHLDELGAVARPVGENLLRPLGARVSRVVLHQLPEQRFVGGLVVPELARQLRLLLGLGQQRLEIHHRGVAALVELAVEVEHVGNAAGHAGREIPSRRA